VKISSRSLDWTLLASYVPVKLLVGWGSDDNH